MLDDFVIKKTLGKGTFGKVLLVQNQNKQKYALKIVPFKALETQNNEKEYIFGQINFLKSMNSPYIIKLYQDFIDDQNIYMVLEFCNMGDLQKYQNDLTNHVFTLEKATNVLKDVIIGLEQVHKSGSVHRDIKSNNILVHNENGTEIFKLADFGFVKKSEQIRGTILGTQFYMSPQIYDQSKDLYGFQIDMWAFGVLFYYMLNRQFPFKIKMGWSPKQKRQYLIQRATNFSFKKMVSCSNQGKMENCTPQLEDLFKKMFEINGEKRITFSQIRKHPIFSHYFPIVDTKIQEIYGTVLNFNMRKRSSQAPQIINGDISKNFLALLGQGLIRMKEKQFQGSPEKLILQEIKKIILFIKDNASTIYKCDLIPIPERTMLTYNLLKYSILKLKIFKKQLYLENLMQKYPEYDWKLFLNSTQFNDFIWEVDHQINKGSQMFINIYLECQHYLKEIYQINSSFSSNFSQQIHDDYFTEQQKECFDKSVLHVFKQLEKNKNHQNDKAISRIKYVQSLILLSYGFFKNFDNRKNIIETVMKKYLQIIKQDSQLNVEQMKKWIEQNCEEVINNIFYNVMKSYCGVATVKTT